MGFPSEALRHWLPELVNGNYRREDGRIIGYARVAGRIRTVVGGYVIRKVTRQLDGSPIPTC